MKIQIYKKGEGSLLCKLKFYLEYYIDFSENFFLLSGNCFYNYKERSITNKNKFFFILCIMVKLVDM